jgi:hypothetical protein
MMRISHSVLLTAQGMICRISLDLLPGFLHAGSMLLPNDNKVRYINDQSRNLGYSRILTPSLDF